MPGKMCPPYALRLGKCGSVAIEHVTEYVLLPLRQGVVDVVLDANGVLLFFSRSTSQALHAPSFSGGININDCCPLI